MEDAVNYIEKLFQNDSGGHDASHSLRGYQNALQLAESEPGCCLEVISLAALLHDADDHKLFHTENNANARAFLEAHQVEAEAIERICRIINAVSFSKNRGKKPESIEGMIVQDADRLDAIGAIGIARTFAFGGEHGRPFDDSIRHFHEKLLLLKGEMNTERAKQLAEERHAFMVAFLEEYQKETGGK